MDEHRKPPANQEEVEAPRVPEREEDAPPDDEEVMLILGSSHDSVTDFQGLLDETADEDDET